jgi:hypothetical protein
MAIPAIYAGHRLWTALSPLAAKGAKLLRKKWISVPLTVLETAHVGLITWEVANDDPNDDPELSEILMAVVGAGFIIPGLPSKLVKAGTFGYNSFVRVFLNMPSLTTLRSALRGLNGKGSLGRFSTTLLKDRGEVISVNKDGVAVMSLGKKGVRLLHNPRGLSKFQFVGGTVLGGLTLDLALDGDSDALNWVKQFMDFYSSIIDPDGSLVNNDRIVEAGYDALVDVDFKRRNCVLQGLNAEESQRAVLAEIGRAIALAMAESEPLPVGELDGKIVTDSDVVDNVTEDVAEAEALSDDNDNDDEVVNNESVGSANVENDDSVSSTGGGSVADGLSPGF